MDILPVLDQLNIPYQTTGHKHCRPGWANTACCFCTGNPGLHLGIRLDGSGAYCWRCGSHPIYSTLSKLSHTPENKVRALAKKYVGMKPQKTMAEIMIRRKAFKLPSDINGLSIPHERYLTKRNFLPNSLVKLWGIVGAGPISKLGNIDYKWRVLAPIIWEGKMVSFQARAISDKVEPKYKACPKDREVILHQHIVYCHPNCDWSKPVVIVEGITDVWRLGIQAVGVFGIEYLPQQVRAICRKKREAGDKRLVVMFDDDPQAVVKGIELVSDLNFRGMNARMEIIVGDPGAMAQKYADKLMRRLLK